MAVRTYIVPERKKVIEYLKKIGLRSGDIIFRESYSEGPFGLPFSTLVSKLTKSQYSHASVILIDGENIDVLEVNDRGVIRYRLIDWLDFCVDGEFSIYRYKNLTEDLASKLKQKIIDYLEDDADYDFIYADSSKLYCTESVCQIYKETGIPICEPSSVEEVLSGWRLTLFKILNSLVYRFTKKGFQPGARMYFVGNKDKGMLSSPHLDCIVPENPFA